MKNILFAAFVSVTILFLADRAKADVTFQIDDVAVLPGTTFDVDILATGDDDLLFGFNLPVDIGNDGSGVPAGLTLNGGNGAIGAGGFSNPIFPGLGSTRGGAVGNSDFVANSLDLTFAGESLTAAPLAVYTVSFTVASDVADGTVFDLAFLAEQPFDVQGAGGVSIASDPTLTLANGSITVVSVPEPSGLALLALGVCGVATRRQRKRS